MRVLLASVIATLALVMCAAKAMAQVQVPNKDGKTVTIWIYPPAPTYLPQNPNPPASLAPRSFRYGPYVSPFAPFNYSGSGTLPYSRYTAPLWYYDAATNTFHYGRGYYLTPQQ